MPGVKQMLVGAAWAAIGLAVTGATYSAASAGGTYVVAYGAILVGGFQFVVGAGQFALHYLRSGKARARLHAQAAARGIVQAMAATCAADGEISEEEVSTVSMIYRQIFGGDLSEATVREAAVRMRDTDFDIGEALGDSYRLIEPELRPMVLKAAYLVAAADGTVGEAERKVLANIATSLRMTGSELDAALAELRA